MLFIDIDKAKIDFDQNRRNTFTCTLRKKTLFIFLNICPLVPIHVDVIFLKLPKTTNTLCTPLNYICVSKGLSIGRTLDTNLIHQDNNLFL